MIDTLISIGVDDPSTFVWGLVIGSLLVSLWIGSWFVGESALDRLGEPSRRLAEDQAIALGNSGQEASS